MEKQKSGLCRCDKNTQKVKNPIFYLKFREAFFLEKCTIFYIQLDPPSPDFLKV